MKFNQVVKLASIGLGAFLFSGLGQMDHAYAKTKVNNVSNNKNQSIDIVLKSKNPSAMGSMAYQTVNSGSKSYHKFLTPKQFASKYGQSNSKVKAIQRYLTKYHLKTKVYSGNLIMRVNGSTKNINKAFNTKLVNVKTSTLTYQKPSKTPKLPGKLNSSIYSLVGMSTYVSFNNYAQKNDAKMNPSSFIKRSANSLSTTNSPQKFAKLYDLDSLYAKNYTGKGKTIGIITFANYHPSDAYTYWKSENIPAKSKRISVYRTDGYKGSWDGSDESTMDVEQAGAVAPKANIRTYIGQSSIIGMVNSIASANSENKVDTLSISWGQSESRVAKDIKLGVTPKKYNQILNILFQQAAIQGISTFAASGDNGAYDGILDGSSSGLAVDTPANSAYVTSVGGTTLPKTYRVNKRNYSVTKERAWGNEFLYPNYNHQHFYSQYQFLSSYFAGGGGGFSKYNSTPKYQRGFSGVGTYDATKLWNISKGKLSLLSKPQQKSGKSNGRNVPDLSANADPNTGYSAYISSGSKGNWYIVGGTSVTAPQMAAASTVLSQSNQTRLGFWNPQIYKFAKRSNSPFHALNDRNNNTNLYFTGQPGKLYNQATGLGTVNFSLLDKAFN